MKVKLSEVVDLVEGTLVQGDPSKELTNFESLATAYPDSLSFYGNPKYADDFKNSRAGAILVSSMELTHLSAGLIVVDRPVLAFDTIIREFGVAEIEFQPGVHPAAIVAPDVVYDPEKVRIEAGVVVESGAQLADGVWLGANSWIGPGVEIGEGTRIYPLVCIREGSKVGRGVIIHSQAVIGADGYGYEFAEGRHQKIRQAGIVEIEDEVEIGAGTTIDRARFGSTVIGEGTKIDNLVQVGHNVQIGKHCLIVALTGLSGSCRIGDYVTVAAQSGVAGHVVVGDKAILGGRTGVIADLPGDQTYLGYPAKPLRVHRRQSMYAKKIPSLLERIAALENKLAEWELKEKTG